MAEILPARRIDSALLSGIPWYTLAIPQNEDLVQVNQLKSFQAFVEQLQTFEKRLFGLGGSLSILNMQRLLGLGLETSGVTHKIVSCQTNQKRSSSDYSKICGLVCAYRLVDVIALLQGNIPRALQIYQTPCENPDRLIYGMSRLVNWTELLAHFRLIMTKAKRPVAEILPPAPNRASFRLLRMISRNQWMKGVSSIENNFLHAAMHIACMKELNFSQDSYPDMPYKMEMTKGGDQTPLANFPVSDQEREDLEEFSMLIMAFSKQQEITDALSLLRAPLHLSLMISPLFLLIPSNLTKRSFNRKSLLTISKLLGNNKPDSIIAVEKVLWTFLFRLAEENVDSAVLLHDLCDTLDWNQIESAARSAHDRSWFDLNFLASPIIHAGITLQPDVTGEEPSMQVDESSLFEERMQSLPTDDAQMDRGNIINAPPVDDSFSSQVVREDNSSSHSETEDEGNEMDTSSATLDYRSSSQCPSSVRGEVKDLGHTPVDLAHGHFLEQADSPFQLQREEEGNEMDTSSVDPDYHPSDQLNSSRSPGQGKAKVIDHASIVIVPGPCLAQGASEFGPQNESILSELPAVASGQRKKLAKHRRERPINKFLDIVTEVSDEEEWEDDEGEGKEDEEDEAMGEVSPHGETMGNDQSQNVMEISTVSEVCPLGESACLDPTPDSASPSNPEGPRIVQSVDEPAIAGADPQDDSGSPDEDVHLSTLDPTSASSGQSTLVRSSNHLKPQAAKTHTKRRRPGGQISPDNNEDNLPVDHFICDFAYKSIWEPAAVKEFVDLEDISFTKHPIPPKIACDTPLGAFDAEGIKHNFQPLSHDGSYNERLQRFFGRVEKGYEDGLPLHIANPARSGFKTISYAAFKDMPANDFRSLILDKNVVVTGHPHRRLQFDEAGLRSVTPLDSQISILDYSFPKTGTLNAAPQIVSGIARDILENAQNPNGKILNGLDFPIWGDNPRERIAYAVDVAAWDYMQGKAFSGLSTTLYPATHMRWGLVGTANTITFLHIDSDGFSTFVQVVCGKKVWGIYREAPDVPLSSIDVFMDKTFVLDDLLDESTFGLEAIVLRPGDMIFLRPGTPHFVYDPEHTICQGGHFYATCLMQDTLVSLCHSFVVGKFISNTVHHPSRMLLRKILLFYGSGLLENRIKPTDAEYSHLPDITKFRGLLDLISACTLAILGNVLDFRTYSSANQHEDSNTSKDQIFLMSTYDRNDISSNERMAICYARGVALSIFEWVRTEFVVTHPDGQIVDDLPSRFLIGILKSLLAYKAKAMRSKCKGAPHCSTTSLKKQVLNVIQCDQLFRNLWENGESIPDDSLAFQPQDGYSVERKLTVTGIAPSPHQLLQKGITPLDLKFQQGEIQRAKLEKMVEHSPSPKRRKM